MSISRRLNSVKDLNGKTGCGWMINVKLCRVWDRHQWNNHDVVVLREMMLMDDKGDKIVAAQPHDQFNRLGDLLQEGSSKQISNFGCVKNSDRFKQCSHPFKIEFDARTVIAPGNDIVTKEHGDDRGFKFVSFSDIPNFKPPYPQLIDIINSDISQMISLFNLVYAFLGSGACRVHQKIKINITSLDYEFCR
ncbi:OLC1v1012986C1 [Oldenlandia corymbosa var. corymbosa]|uniref:OLC1v1012986C1 n=1 Tax=Oldenlandia corymbosa var. corymbosa TaxID=529605 RepID=A0AAV1DXH8_OLDCO|nr:OLC1v1012986C1 [Oldenlandia corymbosa var. corymbosa]